MKATGSVGWLVDLLLSSFWITGKMRRMKTSGFITVDMTKITLHYVNTRNLSNNFHFHLITHARYESCQFEQTNQDKCGNKAVDFVFKSADLEDDETINMKEALVCCCTSGDM